MREATKIKKGFAKVLDAEVGELRYVLRVEQRNILRVLSLLEQPGGSDAYDVVIQWMNGPTQNRMTEIVAPVFKKLRDQINNIDFERGYSSDIMNKAEEAVPLMSLLERLDWLDTIDLSNVVKI